VITLIRVPLCLEGRQEVGAARERKWPPTARRPEAAERMHESGEAGGRVVVADQGRPAHHLTAGQREGNPREESCQERERTNVIFSKVEQAYHESR
jgi:hypothetical protein